jgi:hypothetical protein
MASLECISGPIKGLCLPRHAWEGLQKHGINTFDQLVAVADRLERLERLERIGPKTAQVVRKELARIEFP